MDDTPRKGVEASARRKVSLPRYRRALYPLPPRASNAENTTVFFPSNGKRAISISPGRALLCKNSQNSACERTSAPEPSARRLRGNSPGHTQHGTTANRTRCANAKSTIHSVAWSLCMPTTITHARSVSRTNDASGGEAPHRGSAHSQRDSRSSVSSKSSKRAFRAPTRGESASRIRDAPRTSVLGSCWWTIESNASVTVTVVVVFLDASSSESSE